MYDAPDATYCYRGTDILKSKAGLRSAKALEEFELAMVAQRADEPLPHGRFSVTHYRAIHHHLFQDVYSWAGKFRTVRMSKGGNPFCYPENISHQMAALFDRLKRESFLRGLERPDFAERVAAFLTMLNAIHPFRDGNGRTQVAFVGILAFAANHPLDFARLDPRAFLEAMVKSFHGEEEHLVEEIRRMSG